MFHKDTKGPSLIRHNIITGKMNTEMTHTGLVILNSPGIQVLSNNFGSLCLQWLLISSFLLRVAKSGVKRMWYFSRVQRLQIPVDGE